MASAMAGMEALKGTHQQLKSKMESSVEDFRGHLLAARTGRANVHMLDTVKVDYYGTETPVAQMGQVSTPEPTLILVQPYDLSMIGAIEKAIRTSPAGLNPMSDGKVIRVPVPPMTEERRKELVKVVRHKAEEGKVAVRNLRRAGRHDLEALQKDGDLSTDELERVEKDLEKITQDQVAVIDQLLAHKEQELLQV